MGLPIKQIINYIEQLKNEKNFGIIGNPIKHSLSPILLSIGLKNITLTLSILLLKQTKKIYLILLKKLDVAILALM